jgi:predicted ABC-type ATPase
MPHAYIIAGPNGAGKTTFARRFLPRYAACRYFLNADVIAQGLAPFAPDTAAVRAGRMMLKELRRLAGEGADFGFETTLSGRSYVRWFRDLRDRGYRLHLYFLWLPTVEIALQRVADRVRHGGHAIPEADVRRRFPRGVHNLVQLYRPILDEWYLFDNSAGLPATIAFEVSGDLSIVRPDLYQVVLEQGRQP